MILSSTAIFDGVLKIVHLFHPLINQFPKMTQVTKSFEEHNLIPDVLPAGTQVPHNLGIHWPKVNLRAPGDRLHRDELQETPTITTDLKVSLVTT